MICSSVYLVRFIVRPFVGSDSNSKWRKNPVAGHLDLSRLRVAPSDFRQKAKHNWSDSRAAPNEILDSEHELREADKN